jgi:hypothetical protein
LFKGTDKVKLAALLKEAMANEKLCVAEECECFLAGVPCHADVCGCCVGKKCKGSVDCSNPKVSTAFRTHSPVVAIVRRDASLHFMVAVTNLCMCKI